eukprot:3931650-Rhodomonas_salina.1
MASIEALKNIAPEIITKAPEIEERMELSGTSSEEESSAPTATQQYRLAMAMATAEVAKKKR